MASSRDVPGPVTVTALKAAFLRSQIRTLSQPLSQPASLEASSRRGDAQDGGGGGYLPPEVVGEVVREVNRLLRRHSNTVYPSLAVRHVAEQIDKLYWDLAAPYDPSDAENDVDLSEEGSGPLRISDDLTLPQNISRLPPRLNDDETPAATAKRYEDRVRKLHALSARREALQDRVRTYRAALSLLEPYRNPSENVQPNLVTRDGELSAELSRTRALGVRVMGRAEEWAGSRTASSGAGGDGELELDGERRSQRRLDELMGAW